MVVTSMVHLMVQYGLDYIGLNDRHRMSTNSVKDLLCIITWYD
jgi:hypothetical protein